MLLTTDTLRLRAIEPEDLETIYTVENDTMLWDISNTAVPYSKFALREYFTSQPSDIFQTGQLRLAIEKIREGKTIGFIDLTDFSPLSLRAEVGLILLRAYRQLGYGTQVLSLIENYASQHLRLRFLYAHISEENNPLAQKLFIKAGYKKIATLPQWHHCSQGYEDISIFQKFLPASFP